jgi:predicted permease
MKPPALPRRLLSRILPEHLRDVVIDDLDEEFRLHIAPARSAGRARAWYWRQALGSIPGALRRRGWWRVPIREFVKDLRHGGRLLRRQPGFAAAALVTMALGLAATTAVFTITYAVLLRALPYTDPGQLVSVTEIDTRRERSSGNVSYPDFLDYRDTNASLVALAGHNGGTRTLTGSGPADRVAIAEVTEGFFSMLGVRPALGRDFEPADAVDGAPQVAILNDGAWRRRFGADAAIVGKTMTLSGQRTTIVGVLPAEFEFPPRGTAEIWMPIQPSQSQRQQRFRHWLEIVGRLRPGTTIDRAREDLDLIARRFATVDPDFHPAARVNVSPLTDQIVGGVRPTLVVLLAAAGFLLVASCASIGGLIVARSRRRLQEMIVRTAIGASAGRLGRQLVAEGVAIAIPGTALGVLLGYGLVRFFTASIPLSQRAALPHMSALTPDPVVLLVVAGLSFAAALGFSLVPAWQVSRPNAAALLRVRDASVPGRNLGAVFVTVQLALALVLLTGAGLLGRSVYRLLHTSPGFETDGLLTMRLTLTGRRFASRPAAEAFHRDVVTAIDALPDANGAATINQLPLTGAGNSGTFTIYGTGTASGSPAGSASEHSALVRSVSANYFDVMAIPITTGRPFAGSDRENTPRVVLVNQRLADLVFGGRALGQRISFPFFKDQPWWEIAGIVGDEQLDSLDRAMMPVVYFAHSQAPDNDFFIVVRTTGDPSSLAASVRSTVSSMDASLPVFSIATMDGIIANSNAVYRRRTALMLVAGFAGAALVLALVGLYAMVSQTVSQRTREIGIRVALGARRDEILKTMLRRGLRPVLAGLAFGIPASLAFGPWLGNLLYEVSSRDVTTIGAVVGVFSLVGVAACVIPAVKATRIDPVEAIRD